MRVGRAASTRVSGRTPLAPLPASGPKRLGSFNGRTSAEHETSLPKVCSFQLPKVCSFQLPLTNLGRRDGRLDRRYSPACAGNTSSPAAARRRSAVQPRVCGEHIDMRGVRAALFGTAPRVRGTQRDGRGRQVALRYSPACAGNTSTSGGCSGRSSVQPRVCGEHPAWQGDTGPDAGTAPRLRGTRRGGHRRHPDLRYSPACAGNTLRPLAAALRLDGTAPRVRGTLAPTRPTRRP